MSERMYDHELLVLNIFLIFMCYVHMLLARFVLCLIHATSQRVLLFELDVCGINRDIDFARLRFVLVAMEV